MASQMDLTQQPPRAAVAHYQTALALTAGGRLWEAVAACDRAIALAPAWTEPYDGKAELLHDLARPAEALAALELSIGLDPRNPQRHWKAGLCCLQMGNYARGWPLYQARQAFMFVPRSDGPGRATRVRRDRLWSGAEDLSGRSLFLQSEQGLGDLMQFCRYVPLLEERGARVVLSVPAQMRRVLAGLSVKTVIVSDGDPRPDTDFDCLLLSLPAAFGTTVDTIPSRVPYLAAEPPRVELWRDRLAAPGFRIGVCWQGKTGPADQGRSLPLTVLAPLAGLPGVRLISLQKPDAYAPPAELAAARVEDLDAELDGAGHAFVDSAAVMQSLDLVITVDSAVAHLAGALGVPTWVALKFAPDWRWMLGRQDSPWYPTLRLFRQPRIGDWTAVIEAMLQALRSGGRPTRSGDS